MSRDQSTSASIETAIVLGFEDGKGLVWEKLNISTVNKIVKK